MSAAIPLLGHPRPDAPFAYRPQGAVGVAGFLDDVHRVAGALPGGGHVLNVCRDRYRFTVGLAACLVAGKVSLLPSTHTPEMVRQLKIFAPDTFCLDDGGDPEIDLPHVAFPDAGPAAPTRVRPIPVIPAERLVAYVFTSGSTGAPIPHKKHWGHLVGNAKAGARSLGLDDGRAYSVVGTVPPQHMYGFESTVLVSLHGGAAAWSGRPFYPADIAAALAGVPRPRVLVTTPFHLRSLLDAGIAIPETDLVVSATAPLSAALAHAAETRLDARLQEIYGSTETGQIATRYPTAGIEWTLMRDIGLETAGAPPFRTFASGGHVEGRVPLGDVLEITAGNRFLLHGRNADLINIAGKRTSLAYLNHQLTHLPGVLDGCFYMPDEEGDDGVTRLMACVVAPGLSAADLARALRRVIDPVFLPRPLLLVGALPRNATGKLPRPALQALLAEHLSSRAAS